LLGCFLLSGSVGLVLHGRGWPDKVRLEGNPAVQHNALLLETELGHARSLVMSVVRRIFASSEGKARGILQALHVDRRTDYHQWGIQEYSLWALTALRFSEEFRGDGSSDMNLLKMHEVLGM